MPKSILIIEDDRDTRNALGDCLELLGCKVEMACNGEEGLKILAQKKYPDLIFLDLMMPIMDGWEFCSRLKIDSKISKIPVIVFSADGNAKEKSQKLNVLDGFKKPFDFEIIQQILKKYLS